MPVIKPSRHFEGSKLHSWKTEKGIYRAVFKKYYESATSKGYQGFKMQWELISDPAFLYEVTNSYSYRKIGLHYKLMEGWNLDKKRKIQKAEKNQLPDLTEWVGQEADVVVGKLGGIVAYITCALPPGTLLVREGIYTYRAIRTEFYLNNLLIKVESRNTTPLPLSKKLE